MLQEGGSKTSYIIFLRDKIHLQSDITTKAQQWCIEAQLPPKRNNTKFNGNISLLESNLFIVSCYV